MKRILAITLGVMILMSAACGARVPKTKTAENVSRKFFIKYAKNFKTSDVGQYKVKGTRLLEVQEIHKNMVMATIEVNFIDGPNLMTKCVLEKKPFGWKLVSWEKM